MPKKTTKKPQELSGTLRGDPSELIKLAMELEAAGRKFSYTGSSSGGPSTLWIEPIAKPERPLCGAQTRAGGSCQAQAVNGGQRCRMHGGLSTGPKTAAGRARIAESNRQRRARADQLIAEIEEMKAKLKK